MSTDYQRELQRIDEDVAQLTALESPGTEQLTRRAYRLYQRAALTGRLDAFAVAEEAIQQAFDRVGAWPDLCLVKANLDMKFHRLTATRRDLEMAPGLAASYPGRVIWADIYMQEGQYALARTALQSLVGEDPKWDTLARLAYWESKFGDTCAADRIYDQAAEEITSKEMRGYCWVELQRGLLDLRSGRYQDAAAHYARANAAYSGYWLVYDHLAELSGTQGRFEEAVALYERVIAETPRPELQQAFGELYSAMGDSEKAAQRFDQALTGYLDGCCNGGVHYYHHLVDFYSDVRENGPLAVYWARRDCELRRNSGTEAALGWALFRDGKLSEACASMDRALASGYRDAHVFAKAAAVYAAAGQAAKGEDLSRRAREMNPGHNGFHVHRS